jgi:hypothetical protein
MKTFACKPERLGTPKPFAVGNEASPGHQGAHMHATKRQISTHQHAYSSGKYTIHQGSRLEPCQLLFCDIVTPAAICRIPCVKHKASVGWPFAHQQRAEQSNVIYRTVSIIFATLANPVLDQPTRNSPNDTNLFFSIHVTMKKCLQNALSLGAWLALVIRNHTNKHNITLRPAGYP